MKKHGKILKALVLFGSSVYNPLRSRDLDLLVVIDKLTDAKEKHELEVEILKSLRQIKLGKPIDVLVLDIEMLKENAKPGGVVSGLILGYKSLYDELGISTIVEKITDEVSEEKDYVVIKENRKLNLYILAKLMKKNISG